MSAQPIETVPHPVVGAFYLVPTVFSAKHNVIVPIYGPLHDDLEYIGFEQKHWHVDWRFAYKRFFNLYLRSRRSGMPAFLHGVVVTTASTDGRAVTVRRMRLKREMPPYPDTAPWLNKLESAYKNYVLPKCRTCPHRGISLKNAVPDENGVVTCTGHGLRWNLATGALVRSGKVAA